MENINPCMQGYEANLLQQVRGFNTSLEHTHVTALWPWARQHDRCEQHRDWRLLCARITMTALYLMYYTYFMFGFVSTGRRGRAFCVLVHNKFRCHKISVCEKKEAMEWVAIRKYWVPTSLHNRVYSDHRLGSWYDNNPNQSTGLVATLLTTTWNGARTMISGGCWHPVRREKIMRVDVAHGPFNLSFYWQGVTNKLKS